MSRLIVKGLPPSFTEEKLRKHFSGQGAITDCTLKYTRDGKFRRFAFLGFESEENAAKAAQYFDQTFVGTARITVEECKPFGDDTKPRAWSKYSRENQKRPLDEKPGDSAEIVPPPVKRAKPADAKYAEFMGLNDVNPNEQMEEEREVDESKDLMSELMNGIYGDTKLSLILSGLPPTIKASSLKDWLNPIRFKAAKIVRNSSESLAFVTFNRAPDVRRALLRSDQYLGGFRIKIDKAPISEEEAAEIDQGAQLDPAEEAAARKSESEKITASILETGRLFVRNLPYTCKEDDLMFLFKQFGEVAECQNVIDKKTGKSKGFAVVTFVFPENAAAAYASLDGSIFKGRMLHLLPGEEKREDKLLDASAQKGLSAFQKEKQVKLKANAGKTHSWNALFLGANAVADTLASKLDVSKADLLTGDDDGTAGVRLALAETRLVRETREFLIKHGVKLDAFSRPAVKRSDTVMIVKNLPAQTDEDELRRMFGRFGDIKQFIMPPDGGVSAIIEMDNSIDAKKAFTSLAYSRFRNQPLYLEWAPGDVFGEELKPNEAEENPQQTEEELLVSEKKRRDLSKEEKKMMRRSKKHRDLEESIKAEYDQKVEEMNAFARGEDVSKQQVKVGLEGGEGSAEQNAEERVPDQNATLFVKNLNFDTTDKVLYTHFNNHWPVVNATVSVKKDIKNPDKLLSMGFGFVQFYAKSDAEAALRQCQGELLDGHALELKLSHREQQQEEAAKRKGVSILEQGDCTNIMVRNIPFQASKKEITQLFSAFGELKSVRLPKKVGGSGSNNHRGFGFVDFMTKGDAKRGFEALVHSTHLYGRRLVLEWAKTEETIEELRERTKEKFSGEKGFKKRKDRLDAIERDVVAMAEE